MPLAATDGDRRRHRRCRQSEFRPASEEPEPRESVVREPERESVRGPERVRLQSRVAALEAELVVVRAAAGFGWRPD